MSNNRTNDPMVKFASVKVGTEPNAKGQKRTQLYIEVADAVEMAKNIVEAAEASEGRGVKLDLYTAQRINKQTNRPFDAAFAFVKAKQEASFGGFGGKVAKPVNNDAETKAAIEALKNKQL